MKTEAAYLAAKRAEALAKLGTHWLLHKASTHKWKPS